MDVSLLQQIVQLMKANDLSSVELCDGDRRITLKRGGEAPPPMAVAHQPMHLMPSAAPSPQTITSAPAPSGAAPATDTDAGLQQIKSPMVGTFYASPSPDAKPFVSVGAQVDEDTDVCVIEAMKVFNNIKAETRGTIAKVLVTNGQPVEFGQTLFLVKPG
jgi:acetyl-CoA carboxylase biotin carboxyl carrier protein